MIPACNSLWLSYLQGLSKFILIIIDEIYLSTIGIVMSDYEDSQLTDTPP